MKFKGITKRWVFNSLGIIVLLLITIESVAYFSLHNLYRSQVKQNLTNTLESLSKNLKEYYEIHSTFSEAGQKFMEEFSESDRMELVLMDSDGNIMFTSTGFPPEEEQKAPDVLAVKNDRNEMGYWLGSLATGESVMAVSGMVFDGKNHMPIAILRLITSMTKIEQRFWLDMLFLLIVGAFVLSVAIFSGIYFINTIVGPVKEAVKTAKLIAHGDFASRISIKYNDEIGDLCTTINSMAEELGTSERLKNDFISSVSHELRTPLTAIQGWAETMKELSPEGDRETYQRGLQIISEESNRLSEMVEELLDFSRMESGRIKLDITKMDIVAELSESVYIFKERARRSNITLDYAEPDFPVVVMGDSQRIRQVFLNILENAVKYSEANTVIYIRIFVEKTEIQVVIKDEGCGIPEKDLPHITEKFYRANTAKRGSGIGLALVEEITRLHGGRLQIKSREGQGTTVIFSLPLANGEEIL